MDKQDLDRQIIKLLEENPDISAKDISSRLAIPEEEILRTMKRLSDTNPKIMIVDDEPDATIATRRALEMEGYTVLDARNGKEGLKLLETETPDLILLDVMMPEMDGFEVCRILREDNKHKHIPIIMLTAKGELDDRIEGLEIGSDDYITKPYNLRELKARIRTVLRRSQD